LDNSSYYTTLFSVPKMSVGLADFAIGLYASALLKDGGTLQVGIGVLGDALVHATSLRHLDNTTYHHALKQLGLCEKVLALIEHIGGTSPFEKGLYSATEMFVDGLLYLYEAGVLKRKVYDFWALEQLVQNKQCDPTGLDECLFTQMASLGVREITPQNLITLQEHGVLPHSVLSEGADFILPNGKCVVANLVCSETCLELGALAVGRVLQNGVLLHGGFFLGTQAMYHTLSQFSQSERDLFSMTGVDKVNQLDENPLLYHAQRVHARFINTGLVLTLSGAVASDGLDDGRVISGVGGQYNFVAMAEQLEDARSILLIRAVRERAGEISSNVVFNYGHCTIPRHLRDIVVTEYGVADLQGKTDREIAKALIEIADSRFQGLLLEQAKKAGKIEAAYVIPSRFLNNTPQGLQAKLSGLQRQGFLPEYPLGTDFTEQEQMLEKALLVVKKQTTQKPKWVLAVCALFYRDISNELKPYLERMQLTQAVTLEDKVVRMLLCQALQKQINAMAQ
jgi:acyl-CoA hydrolase